MHLIITIFFLFTISISIYPSITKQFSSSDSQTYKQLLQTSQFFFIPNSSYLQFRVSSLNMGKSNSVSQIVGNVGFNITNNINDLKKVSFNVILLPNISQNYTEGSSNMNWGNNGNGYGNINVIDNNGNYIGQSQDQGQSLSQIFYFCYIKAAFEGLNNINCSNYININSTSQGGNCSQCIQSALNLLNSNLSNSSTPIACLNCYTNFSVQLFQSLDFQQDNQQNKITNQNLLFIIDNTNVINTTGIYLEMFLLYNVNIQINQSDQTIVEFFLIMLIVLIVITLIIAVYLTIKINKVNVVVKNYIKNQ